MIISLRLMAAADSTREMISVMIEMAIKILVAAFIEPSLNTSKRETMISMEIAVVIVP